MDLSYLQYGTLFVTFLGRINCPSWFVHELIAIHVERYLQFEYKWDSSYSQMFFWGEGEMIILYNNTRANGTL